MKKKLMLAFVILMMCLTSWTQNEPSIPHLRNRNNIQQLIVDGKPVVLLSGELHNSTASSMDYMESIWPRLKRLNMNSVIASVSWELIEPVEGKFDFSGLDDLVMKARENNMKLVLLWFASWKNSASTYAPGWVRQNTKRFPRVQNSKAENLNSLSCFSDETCKADAKAFGALMKHLKEFDGKNSTVVAIQVQNEPGVRKTPRDFNPLANKKFEAAVPKALITFLAVNKTKLIPEFDTFWKSSGYKTEGNWTELFGKDADEIFMAWNIASYLDKVAEAGKNEYPIPLYANAWLDSPDGSAKPGDYPSGGPVAKVVPVYQAAAPHLDFLAPDIYRSDFVNVCGLFQRMGNPLFIPESPRTSIMPANAFFAIGEGALCFAPFGIDNLSPDDTLALSQGYLILSGLMPLITEYQGTGKMKGIQIPSGETKVIDIGDYTLSFRPAANRKIPAYGLIIARSKNEYLVAGDGFTVTFLSKSKTLPHAEILSAYELKFRNNQWIKQRRLNGDETGRGSDHNIMLQFNYNKPVVLTAEIFSYE
jgi:hypothetical protein